MADLGSHVLVGYLAGARSLSRLELGWLVTGTLLPDLASRVPRKLIGTLLEAGVFHRDQAVTQLLMGLDFPHTPVGMAVVSVLVASLLPWVLLRPVSRPRVAALLFAGGLLHLALDLCQLHLGPAYRLLYPLSMGVWELGWFSTETSLVMLPFLALAALWVHKRGGRPGGRPPS